MVAMTVWPTDGADGSVATEARWRKMGRHWAPSGIAPGVGGNLAPSLAFPNLTVKAGAAWVDGHYCELLSDSVLTATANGIAVVRFDPAANTAELVYRDTVQAPAQSPTGTWELPICRITGSALASDSRTAVSLPTFQDAAERDAKMGTSVPVGAQCFLRDTGWTFVRTYTGAGTTGWVPMSGVAVSESSALGGFPAAAYNWGPYNIAGYFTNNKLMSGGLTLYQGVYTLTTMFQMAPTDAGDVQLKCSGASYTTSMSGKASFGVLSLTSEFFLGAGNQIMWQMYKHANTTGWTNSWVQHTLSFRPG